MRDMGIGSSSEKSAVFIDKDSMPYSVGTFTFREGYGLYIIFGGSDEAYDIMYDVMDSLSYTGIGGKLSVGYGAFDYTYGEVDNEIKSALEGTHKRYMSLSVSMGADEAEIEKAVSDSYFELVKRSGFISSEKYADGFVKKRDFYSFKSGSCFSEKFMGSIFDVSRGGRHPVYRYGIPMFYGID